MLDYLLTEHPIASLIAAIILTTAIAVACVAIPCRYAAVLNADYKFGFYEGCFIKENGKWVDYDRYRIINQE